jgi:hypothetical protein
MQASLATNLGAVLRARAPAQALAWPRQAIVLWAQAGDGHGQHIGHGTDARATVVDDAGGVATVQQLFKLLAQHVGAFEEAFVIEVQGKRAVQRAGDVTGHRVQRLGLAAKAGGGTCIDQGLLGSAQLRGHLGGAAPIRQGR